MLLRDHPAEDLLSQPVAHVLLPEDPFHAAVEGHKAFMELRVEVDESTVQRVLVRNDLARVDHLDRQTGLPIRRYEWKRPGQLVHVDIKKLGRIPAGGGHGIHGRANARRNRKGGVGFAKQVWNPDDLVTVATSGD